MEFRQGILDQLTLLPQKLTWFPAQQRSRAYADRENLNKIFANPLNSIVSNDKSCLTLKRVRALLGRRYPVGPGMLSKMG